MTLDQLIKRSLRTIGVYQSGEQITAEEFTDAVGVLNSMLEMWANKRLLGPNMVRVSKALTTGDGIYTIGTGADIDTTRPAKIDGAFIRQNNTDYTLQQIQRSEYNDLGNKTNSGLPLRFFYDSTLPSGSIYLYPIPDQAYTLYLDLWYRFPVYANPADVVTLQDGMIDAVAYNLAMRLALEYQKPVTPELRQLATESLRSIKMINLDIPLVQTWYKNNYSIEAGL